MAEEKLYPDKRMSPYLWSVADGVWVLQGDIKHGMNIYFIETPAGVVQFDAGTKGMTRAVKAAGQRLGGIEKIVLGHAHADHRGSAAGLNLPILCHADEVADARSDAAIPSYFDLSLLEVAPIKWIYPTLLRRWDGGGVEISDTVAEGDEVAGFEVIHFPGHAPGLIGLWRESDRLAIVSDVVYFVDSARLKALPEGEATIPHPAFAWDHVASRDSLRRLASMQPKTVLAGHAEPLSGDNLQSVLELAADRY